MSAVPVHYVELAPCGALRDAVEAYFCFNAGAAPEFGARHVVRHAHFRDASAIRPALFADARSSLVFDLSASWSVAGLWRAGAAPAFAIGAARRGRATGFATSIEAIGVYLRPGFANAVLGVSARELADRIVPLAALWTDAHALTDRLHETSRWSDRIAQIEAALLARGAARRRRAGRELDALLALAGRGGGRSRVEQIARAAGLSRQQLARRFRDEIGLSPKTFVRLARFRRALAAPADVAWAHVASDAGYADQSHLIAEAREFTGLSPAALRASPEFHPFL